MLDAILIPLLTKQLEVSTSDLFKSKQKVFLQLLALETRHATHLTVARQLLPNTDTLDQRLGEAMFLSDAQVSWTFLTTLWSIKGSPAMGGLLYITGNNRKCQDQRREEIRDFPV